MNNKNLLDKPVAVWSLAILIIYSVISFSIETLPGLSPFTIEFLYYSEMVVVVIFTLEYCYRIYSAENRLGYIFSFMGIIDLLAILPFYLALIVDLRSLRLLRLFRLVKFLRWTGYNNALRRFGQAISLAKEELIIFTLATLMMLYFAAVGIYYFEHEAQPQVFRSIFDSLWWAVGTLTTVGYGDIYPITLGGRLFTFFVLMLGLGLVAVPTGIVASSLLAIRTKKDQ